MDHVREAAAKEAGASAAPGADRCDVLVSVINYRTAEMTIRCVESVLADAGALDVRVAVVDNRSDDGSAEAIERWIATLPDPSRVALIRSATNSGYSGGHNQGMASRPAGAFLVLNSDALLRPGALAALTAELAARPEAGVAGPRLEDEDGAVQISCFRFPSPASELARGAQLGVVTWLARSSVVALPSPPDPAEIGWISFACVLIRAEALAELGPMDEGYFMYFEDADYCWRARRAGWSVVYVPAARVVHLRGGSAPVKKLHAARKRLPPYYYASRTRFLHRTRGRAGLLAANLAWTAGRALSAVKPLFGRRSARVAREPLDLWTNFLAPLGDRRAPGRG